MPVTQFTNSGLSANIDVSADNNNNAFAVYNQSFSLGIYAARNQGGILWQPGTIVINNFSNPCIAMDTTGDALASGASTSVTTAYYSAGIWQTPPPDPLFPAVVDTTILDSDIAMDGAGNGLSCWALFNSSTSITDIYASFFATGTGSWSAPSVIGSVTDAVFQISAAYSINGDAAVVWADLGGFVNAKNFVGSWLGVTSLDMLALSPESYPEIGIDALGNATAIWITIPSFITQVATRRYDALTATWEAAIIFSGSDNSFFPPKIAVAPDGKAVAIWIDDLDNLQMNLFDGTTWGSAIFVAANSRDLAISMDNAGNALIGWEDFSSSEIKAVLYPVGGPLGTTLSIALIPSGNFRSINVALSDNATTGFIVWSASDGESTGNTFGTSILFNETIPTPPLSFAGTAVGGDCTPPIDFVNVLTWEASADPAVVSYYLRRNGVLIAIIPAAGPFTYTDNGRCSQTSVYTLTAVDANGFESTPVTVTLP